jgi:hypothetical protein
MTQKEIDQNLMVVAAVEGYAQKHQIDAAESFGLFKKHGILNMIRSCYEMLHTQSLDESVAFAEDILARKMI